MSKQIVNDRLELAASNNVSDTSDDHIIFALEISAIVRNDSISNNSNTKKTAMQTKKILIVSTKMVMLITIAMFTKHHINTTSDCKNSCNNINNYNNDIDIGKDTAQ